MRKFPIGIQSFSKLIEGGYLYVDKTRWVYDLIQDGKYYFLSRPRRFGKSLLVNTLKEVFQGNQELFKGLWIEDRIEWKSRPVIHLDFSQVVSLTLSLEESIGQELKHLGKQAGLDLQSQGIDRQWGELIEGLGRKERVILLIDEYDTPIVAHLNDPLRAEENQRVLKNFYSLVKSYAHRIEFLFITGITQFPHDLVFSDLKLRDLTLDPHYAQLTGFTETELKDNFVPEIQALQTKYQAHFPDIRSYIRTWYNGYSWDGSNFVYNPFCILNLFRMQFFQDYWFRTGSPTFLMKLIRSQEYAVEDIQGKRVDINTFNKIEVQNLGITSLLFQTGYLTIKHLDPFRNVVTLDFPNREVATAFQVHLLAEFSQQRLGETDALLLKLTDALFAGEVDQMVQLLRQLFSQLTYPNIELKESYFHTIFYLTFKLLGYKVQSEVTTAHGRADVVIEADGRIYVVEIKMGSAEKALQQILEKGYHEQYSGQEKEVYLLGLGFDLEQRNIGDYEVQRISP